MSPASLSSSTTTPIIVTAALATVSCVFPGLATGALTVQASSDFNVTEGSYGWALGVFFLAAALSSTPFGYLAQQLGPQRQIVSGLLCTALVQLSIAFVIDSFAAMLVALAAAGAINSAVQSAVNLALSQAQLPRLGLAVAIKQSAMPTSAMLGGLAVPLVALTVGWRWAYAMGGVVAMCAAIAGIRYLPSGFADAPRRPGRSRGSTGRAVIAAAAMSGCLAFTAGAINAWTVSSGVNAGVSEGVAGLTVSAAAGFGVACRLLIGSRIDAASWPTLGMCARFTLVGVVAMAAMSMRAGGIHIFAALFAFGGGWVWPVFTNFALIDANRERAGAVTGVTQTGVYIGVFLAPVLTGVIIDASGYEVMWLTVAVVGLIGVVLSALLSPWFPRSSDAGSAAAT